MRWPEIVEALDELRDEILDAEMLVEIVKEKVARRETSEALVNDLEHVDRLGVLIGRKLAVVAGDIGRAFRIACEEEKSFLAKIAPDRT